MFFGLGLPASFLLPRSIPERLAVAPIFGFAIFAIVTTLAYTSGILVGATIVLTVAAVISLIACVVTCRDRGWLLFLICAGLVIGILCLTPLWVGGWQFAIFQGNPSDQFNYIAMASAYNAEPYSTILKNGATSELTYLRVATYLIFSRPSVTIVLAAIRPWFYETTAEASYPFLALLQTLSFYGVVFAVRNLFNASRIFGVIAATGFALGFFPQYIVDINAWSSLAALNLAPVLVTLVFLLSTGAAGGGGIVCTALVASGVFYLYPESSAACAIPCFVIAIFCLGPSNPAQRRCLGYIAMSAALTFAACAPVWQTTLAFTLHQLAASHAPWSWFVAHDMFYFSDLGPPSPDWNIARSLAAFISAIAGLFGIYFISPPAPTANVLRIAWRLCEVLFFAAIINAVWMSMNTHRNRIIISALTLSLVPPLILCIHGDYWAAGKAISMASPFLFIVLTCPLILNKSILAIPAALLISLHVGFGLQRIDASRNDTGIRAAYGYPGVPHLKALYDWRLPVWRDRIAGCTNIAVTIKDAHLERLAETFLSDLHIKFEVLTDRNANYYDGPLVVAQAASPDADCSLTDSVIEGVGRQINLARPAGALH